MNTKLQIRNTYVKETIITEQVDEVNEITIGGVYYTRAESWHEGKEVALLDYIPTVGFVVTDIEEYPWRINRDNCLRDEYCKPNRVGVRIVRELYFDKNGEHLIGSCRIVKKPIKVYKRKED